MASSYASSGATGLISVLLITRSRPGPKIVFHYPPDPQVPHNKRGRDVADDDSSSDDSDSGTETTRPTRTRHRSSDATVTLKTGNAARSGGPSLLEYSHDALEKLLSPGRWCQQKKFEVTLNGLTFVGHPIFALEDGKWSKKQPERPSLPKSVASEIGNGYDYYGIGDFEAIGAEITVTAPETPGATLEKMEQRDFALDPDSFDSKAAMSLGTSFNSGSTASAARAEQLDMFHVVFVLAPSHASGVPGAAALYQHVVRPLSKALHFCQKQSQYIARESHRLQTLQTKLRGDGLPDAAVWAHMVETSELAWALREMFEQISKGQVAGIRLGGTEMGLQLPRSTDASDQDTELEPHHGLLLLEDKETLLRQLGHPDASPLAQFISDLVPNKSLQKLTTTTGMPFKDLQYLSRHLIKWRKARVIAPLHARNTYIIAPDAPMGSLEVRSLDYSKHFPPLPPMLKVLKVLGGKPLPYRAVIPSKDHRAPYLEVLAYLVRYGFVVQLRTMGWLKLPASKRRGGPPEQQGAGGGGRRSSRQRMSLTLPSPHLRPLDDDAASVSSERTAIPAATSPARPSDRPTHDDNFGRETIIADPTDPSFDLRPVLEEITDAELRDSLPSLVAYLDGEHELEKVAAREGWKRAQVDGWFDILERQGFLLRSRCL